MGGATIVVAKRHSYITSPVSVFNADGSQSGPVDEFCDISPGEMLPEVEAFDDQGSPFSTKTLRGHYSVFVFGCLT
jgi:cytochrome oxidase Cu insertion factor (SCO1/SenC/PrrC family)